MMKMSVDEEQDTGAGWRYGRKREKKDSQLQLSHQLYEKTGRKEGTLQIRCKEASARWFHASLPQLQHTDAGRHSLGHSYPDGTEFRKILWIKLHDPSDEFLFCDHVPSKTLI